MRQGWHPCIFTDGSDLPMVPWEACDRRATSAASSAPCCHERLGGAGITTLRGVGRKCQYPLAQTTTSMRLLLIVSGDNLDSSCPGDGGCCDGQSSPRPQLLGAGGSLPFLTTAQSYVPFRRPLKQKLFIKINITINLPGLHYKILF